LKFWENILNLVGDLAIRMEEGVKNWRFRPIPNVISKTVQDTTVVTKEDE